MCDLSHPKREGVAVRVTTRCYLALSVLLALSVAATNTNCLAEGARFDFNTDGNADGWTALHGVSSFTVSGGTLQFQVTGPDPYIVSPPISATAGSNPIVAIRMRQSFAETNQIYWSTQAEPLMDENKKVVFESGAPNEFHLCVLDLSQKESWQGTVTRFRIDPGNGTLGEVEIDYVRICSFEELDPVLEIQSLSASGDVLIGVGRSFPVTAQISNSGGGTVHNVSATIEMPAGFTLESPSAVRTLPDMASRTSRAVTWTLRADNPAAGVVRVTADSDETASISSYARLFVSPPIPQGAWSPGDGAGVRQDTDVIWLGNSRARAVFLDSAIGFGACAFDVFADGTWRRMAIMPSFSFLVVEHGGVVERLPIFASDVEIISSGPDTASVRFTGTVEDSQGDDWFLEFLFSIGRNDSVIETHYSAATSASEQLLAFEGPMLYVGAGEFGAEKDAAVFPGLEWLVGDEISSSTLDVTTPAHVRYVPHPNKVTVPAMAVSYQNAAVGLLWNPLAPWYGSSTEPSATFAVPDAFEMKNASLMGLFVPSVLEFVRENSREAKEPCPVGAGETVAIESEIALVYPSDGPLAVQDLWYAREGAPDVLPYPHGSVLSELKLSMDAITGALWLPDEQQWRLYLGGGSFFDKKGRPSEFLLYLELAARRVDDPVLKSAYRTRYDEACAAGASTISFDLPFYVGDPAEAMVVLAYYIASLLDGQRPDGSWRFDADVPLEVLPGETAGFLGPDDAAELGTCANNALAVLTFARLTGDAFSSERGLEALEFMKRFEVPRAAQVWEVPVHTPDVLAAALGSRAFLEGYLLAGRGDLLECGVRWARAGLPFIYAWHEPAHPFMLYGSIPVFGASLYTNPWFGRIVQWNGLELGYSLLRLAPYDSSYDWAKIGTGILVSGMYQQRTDTGYRGTYPDSISAIDGTQGAPYLSPALILKSLLTTMGSDPMPQTVVVQKGGAQIRISTGANICEDRSVTAPDTIGFSLMYPVGEVTYALVAGITEPSLLEKDGATLARVTDLGTVNNGWRYDGVNGLATIKVTHDRATSSFRVRGISPRRVRLVPETRDCMSFHFDDAGDFEGWIPINQFANPTVANGALRGVSSGGDPYIVHLAVRFAADSIDIVSVRMATTSGSIAQFFWATSEVPYFNEANSVVFGIVPDGQYHAYVLNLGGHAGWAGKEITAIRLDPTITAGSNVAIDFIVGGVPGDSDGDGISETLENLHGLDRFRRDSDRDGMDDGAEYQLGVAVGLSDPFVFATNGDILGDFDSGRPFEPDGLPDGGNDTDGDGTPNAAELEQGTNPFDGLDVPDLDGAPSVPLFTSVIVAVLLVHALLLLGVRDRSQQSRR